MVTNEYSTVFIIGFVVYIGIMIAIAFSSVIRFFAKAISIV